MKSHPADEERSRYLELCAELTERAAQMRNFGMKPGNSWLAKAELAKLSLLINELESSLETIKLADASPD